MWDFTHWCVLTDYSMVGGCWVSPSCKGDGGDVGMGSEGDRGRSRGLWPQAASCAPSCPPTCPLLSAQLFTPVHPPVHSVHPAVHLIHPCPCHPPSCPPLTTHLSTHLSTLSTQLCTRVRPAVHPCPLTCPSCPPACPFPVLRCDPAAKRAWGRGGPVVRSGPTCSAAPAGLLTLPHTRLRSVRVAQLGAQPRCRR